MPRLLPAAPFALPAKPATHGARMACRRGGGMTAWRHTGPVSSPPPRLGARGDPAGDRRRRHFCRRLGLGEGGGMEIPLADRAVPQRDRLPCAAASHPRGWRLAGAAHQASPSDMRSGFSGGSIGMVTVFHGYPPAAGPVTALGFTLPLFLTALAMLPLRKEKVGWRRHAAVGVGFLGVLFMVRPQPGRRRISSPLGLCCSAPSPGRWRCCRSRLWATRGNRRSPSSLGSRWVRRRSRR